MSAGCSTVLNRTSSLSNSRSEAGASAPVPAVSAAMAAKSLAGASTPRAIRTSRGNLNGLAVESTTIGASVRRVSATRKATAVWVSQR